MTQKSIKQDLLALETRYWEAIKNKDVDAAMQLSDEPCLVTGPSGVGRIDRETMSQMLRNAPYTLETFSIADGAQVRQLADDVAVLAYDVHETLKVDGRTMSLDASDSSTWVRRNGRWLCAMHSESLRGDPLGRDRVRHTEQQARNA